MTYEDFHFLIQPIIHYKRVTHAYTRGLHSKAIDVETERLEGEKNRKQLLTGALGHNETRQYQNQKNSTGFKGIQVNESEAALRERQVSIK